MKMMGNGMATKRLVLTAMRKVHSKRDIKKTERIKRG